MALMVSIMPKKFYNIDTCGEYSKKNQHNYTTIGITSDKIMSKYGAHGVNYAKKVL